MRLVIVSTGTRGDVGPMVALGGALAAAGHDVRVATHPRFRADVDAAGATFAEIPGDPERMFAAHGAALSDVRRSRPLAHARVMREGFGSLLQEAGPDDYRAACADRDAVAFGLTAIPAYAAATDAGLPAIAISPTPLHPTRAFSHPVLGAGLRLGPIGNPVSSLLAQRVLAEPFSEPLRPGTRRAHGLPPVPWPWGRRSSGWPPVPIVHTFSPALLPRPRDWPEHLDVTGWMTPRDPDPAATLPADVEAFLDAGPPPAYVGFGSMSADPARLTRLVLDAARRAGRRVILATGWGGLDGDAVDPTPGGDVLAVGEVDHRLLFPRTAGVVHHGGAGTVAAGVRAGVPSIVVPFVFDQRFWGTVLVRRGVGLGPLPHAGLTVDGLADALRRLDDPGLRERAADLGRTVRDEDGVAATAAAVVRRLG
ncbi:MAG: glycosyltransferase [Solirubrobacteraceae bacterium]|nr:glycosyltransferase [Solirubrobacteraceae bacterium]